MTIDLSKFGRNSPAMDHVLGLTKHALAMESVTDMLRRLEDPYGLHKTLREIDAQRALLQAAAGPMEDIRRLAVFDHASPLLKEMDHIRKLTAAYESQFHLPDVRALAEMGRQFDALSGAPMLQQMRDFQAVQKAMGVMKSPWMLHDEALRSFSNFAEIQSIGRALADLPAFGDRLTGALRLDLGDWRDPISWPDPIFIDPVARTEFYIDRGFNSSLTNFPVQAFEESVEIAGLRQRPPLVDLYGSPIPESEDPNEEEGFIRTNDAHDWLQRFETRLRRFIDQRMTEAFGPDWAQHRLPNGLHDKWRDKKRTAVQAGAQDVPLIAYADFTDYELIICKRDNWGAVFGAAFGRPESVRESLQRLYPIRICTMHSRPITQDDQLLLYVEVKRLLNSVG